MLIIGGSGFVSGTLAREAAARGRRVWTVTRGQRPMTKGVTALVADRHDTQAFERAVAGAKTKWDMVVDSICYELQDMKQDIALFRDRTRQFVFISTDFVFDPAFRKFPQPEESDHYLTELYGGKKRQCELELINADAGRMKWTIFRPCHIYGPGSQLGCLPLHGRDPQLIQKMRAGETLRLVGGGHFLQQPIFARDLARLILSAAGNRKTYGKIFCAAGPDIIESREYYRIIADILGVGLKVEEVSVSQYRQENPGQRSFLCHRIYDLSRLRAAGLKVPATPIAKGLKEHVRSLLNQHG
jgi:nucleoside-diphosphate-sugar epimerase